MLASEEIRRYLDGGKSMTAATVDASGVPAVCRAVGVRIADDGEGFTVYLPVATAPKSVANIATNGRVALCVSDVIDHSTVQLKGRSRGVRIAQGDEQGFVEAWHAAFIEHLAEIGMPRPLARGLSCWPAFAVDVALEAAYEQTPGPRAGALMRSR